MANSYFRFVGDVQRLELKPDDVLVVSVDAAISSEQAERINDELVQILGSNRNRVIVLGKGMAVSVLGKTH